MNLFDPKLQLKDTECEIKKIKALLSKFKKFKFQTVLALGYKKRNDCKIFNSCTKLIPSDSDIDKSLKSRYQSIMTKIRNYTCKDWIVVDGTIRNSIKVSMRSVSIRRKNGNNKQFYAG